MILVCTLYHDSDSSNGYLYSGSFDCSVKIWNLKDLNAGGVVSCKFSLKGHDHTIWSILVIESQNVLLTGSADKFIKQWELNESRTDAKLVCKYTGHTDCVRGMALVKEKRGNEFLSCSNDGNVLLWRLGSAAPLKQINVTDSFLYSINMLDKTKCEGVETTQGDNDTCLFISSGEDRSVRINNLVYDGSRYISSCLQTIALPAQSIWYCLCLNNGNIAVACSDGSVRIFTQHDEQLATKPEQEEYERELSQFAIPLKTNEALSQLNRRDLPTIEALSVPGKKDGQTLMINNENEIEVYQWDAGEMRWIKIGVAVGSTDGGSQAAKKVSHLGQEYDFVFDIELDESGPKLKLPYNLSEDPYFAAQKFIHKHDLNQVFLDQIAQFIISNTQSETITRGDEKSSDYYDPFTGSGRYVPPPSTSSAAPSNNNRATSGSGSRSAAYDPFTGQNAYRTGDHVPQDVAREAKRVRENNSNSNEYFPHLEYLLFEQSQVEPILKKLKEFQSQLKQQQSNGSSSLSTNESNIELVEHLMMNYSNGDFKTQLTDQFDLLFDMIHGWPVDKVFPLIDCARILMTNRDVVRYLLKNSKRIEISDEELKSTQTYSKNSYLNILFHVLERDESNLTNQLVLYRLVCNLFKHVGSFSKVDDLNELTFKMLAHDLDYLINRLFRSKIYDERAEKIKQNKPFQTALVTVLLNFSILIYNYELHQASNPNLVSLNKSSMESIKEVISSFMNNIDNCLLLFLKFDSEALFRLLVAFGTMITSPKMISASGGSTASAISSSAHIGSKYESFKLFCYELIANSVNYPEKVNKCNQYLVELLHE